MGPIVRPRAGGRIDSVRLLGLYGNFGEKAGIEGTRIPVLLQLAALCGRGWGRGDGGDLFGWAAARTPTPPPPHKGAGTR